MICIHFPTAKEELGWSRKQNAGSTHQRCHHRPVVEPHPAKPPTPPLPRPPPLPLAPRTPLPVPLLLAPSPGWQPTSSPEPDSPAGRSQACGAQTDKHYNRCQCKCCHAEDDYCSSSIWRHIIGIFEPWRGEIRSKRLQFSLEKFLKIPKEHRIRPQWHVVVGCAIFGGIQILIDIKHRFELCQADQDVRYSLRIFHRGVLGSTGPYKVCISTTRCCLKFSQY